MAEIAIGTAQFGLDYGIANRHGRVTPEDAERILQRAHERGCEWIDTATAYGEAEQTLGKLEATRQFKICSKVGANADGDPSMLRTELTESIERLGTTIDVLLLHRSEWLRDDRASAVRKWADEERAAGRIGTFGVSVYGPEEIRPALLAGVEWVQLPLSVLGQSWLQDGHIDRLHDAGVKVQARSLLAQGIVAVAPEVLPDLLNSVRPHLKVLQAAAHQLNVTTVDLALGFAAQTSIDMMVIGVETVAQLDACLDATTRSFDVEWADFACQDAQVLDPRFWPAGLRIAA